MEVLTDLDVIDQTAAELDRGPGVDSTIRLYHRYRKDAERARAEALSALRQAQSDAAAAQKAEEKEKAKAATGWQATLNLIRGSGAKTRDVPRRARRARAEVVAKATTAEQPLPQPAPVAARAAAAEPEVVVDPAPVSDDASLVDPASGRLGQPVRGRARSAHWPRVANGQAARPGGDDRLHGTAEPPRAPGPGEGRPSIDQEVMADRSGRQPRGPASFDTARALFGARSLTPPRAGPPVR